MDYYKIKKVEYCYMEILLIKLLKNVTADERQAIENIFCLPAKAIPADSFLVLNLFKKYQEKILQTACTIEDLEWWRESKEKNFGNRDILKILNLN